MSGAVVPIIPEQDLERNGKFLILVGQSKLLVEPGINTTELEPETFLIKTFDNALVLVGEDGGSISRLDSIRQ